MNLLDGLALTTAERLIDRIDPQQVGEAQYGVERPAHLTAEGGEQGRMGAASGRLDRLGAKQARLDVAGGAFQISDASSGGGELAVMQPLHRANAPVGADRQPDARDARRQSEGDRQ